MSNFIATWFLPIFFFAVGVELKSEVKSGQFSNPRAILNPIFAAIFGVTIPLCLFIFLAKLSSLSTSAWGVVVATDLPLALLASRLFRVAIRERIRPYLLALAIIDDLISILLIAMIYSQNGIHPTVYGFLIGILIPVNPKNNFFNWLNRSVTYLILPCFIASSIFENFKPVLGWLSLIVLTARIIGKPLGVLLGDFVGQKISKTKVLEFKEVLSVGALASLGLSVSYLFVDIAKLPAIASFAILLVIPFALLVIKISAKKLAN